MAPDSYRSPDSAAKKPWGIHLLDLHHDLGRCLQPDLSFLPLMSRTLPGSPTEQIPSRRHLNLLQGSGEESPLRVSLFPQGVP